MSMVSDKVLTRLYKHLKLVKMHIQTEVTEATPNPSQYSETEFLKEFFELMRQCEDLESYITIKAKTTSPRKSVGKVDWRTSVQKSYDVLE